MVRAALLLSWMSSACRICAGGSRAGSRHRAAAASRPSPPRKLRIIKHSSCGWSGHRTRGSMVIRKESGRLLGGGGQGGGHRRRYHSADPAGRRRSGWDDRRSPASVPSSAAATRCPSGRLRRLRRREAGEDEADFGSRLRPSGPPAATRVEVHYRGVSVRANEAHACIVFDVVGSARITAYRSTKGVRCR